MFARAAGDGGRRDDDRVAQQTRAQRCDVAVHHDRVGRQALAAGEGDAADAPAFDENLRCARTIAERRATLARQIGQSRREAVHAALDQPDVSDTAAPIL